MKEAGDMEPIPADRGGGLRGGRGGLPQAEAPSGHTVDGLLNGSYRESGDLQGSVFSCFEWQAFPSRLGQRQQESGSLLTLSGLQGNPMLKERSRR